MSLYRVISQQFWTDRKIVDEFTPEDKYFYLYLLTNPHTNICGCYEISVKHIISETGYNEDTVKRLLHRFEVEHNVIRYDKSTKEIFIINWSKYNWTTSEKFRKAILKVSEYIKSEKFKNLILGLLNNNISIDNINSIISDTDTDTDVCIGYTYHMHTVSKKEKKPDISQIISDYTDNEELKQALLDFVKFRKAIKAPFTERGLTLSLNKLDKLGNTDENKLAVVNQSLERGWKTFYELKEIKQNNDTDISEYNSVINKFLY